MEPKIIPTETEQTVKERKWTGKTTKVETGILNSERTIYLCGEITEGTTAETILRLMQLQTEDPRSDINLIVDSYGGDVYSAIAIVNAMDLITCDVKTLILGKAMSSGAFIFIAGKKGKRFMAPHSRLMLHQASTRMDGRVRDIKSNYEELTQLQTELNGMIAHRSNISCEELEELVNNDAFFSPERARELGFCDGILTSLI
jgi:ATP-dependent Clp protease protease subunit